MDNKQINKGIGAKKRLGWDRIGLGSPSRWVRVWEPGQGTEMKVGEAGSELEWQVRGLMMWRCLALSRWLGMQSMANRGLGGFDPSKNMEGESISWCVSRVLPGQQGRRGMERLAVSVGSWKCPCKMGGGRNSISFNTYCMSSVASGPWLWLWMLLSGQGGRWQTFLGLTALFGFPWPSASVQGWANFMHIEGDSEQPASRNLVGDPSLSLHSTPCLEKAALPQSSPIPPALPVPGVRS